MNVTKQSLGSTKAKTIHRRIINSGRAYSLTITLNTYWNSFPVNEQYNKLSRELVGVFKELAPYYSELMMTPEFTKDYNVHFHVYFTLSDSVEVEVFEQNWKRLACRSKTIGRMYKLKYVDEITEVLLGYPFKDVERTLKYSKVDNCLFDPHHHYYKSEGNILNVVNTPGVPIKKMINKKFMEFVFSEKKI